MGLYKKRSIASLCLAALVFSVLTPPVWAQGATSQEIGRHRATIVSLDGQVEVKSVGSERWSAARANMDVRTGDVIRTGAKGTARVKVGDMGEISIKSGSEVTVGNLKQVRTTATAFFTFKRMVTRDDVEFELNKGDIQAGYNRVQGRVGNYNVFTPVAVAGVRGTKFELDLEGQKPWYEALEAGKGQGDPLSLTAVVLEGEVELAAGGWMRRVTSGQQITAFLGSIPGQAGPADPGRLNDLAQGLADAVAPAFGGLVSLTQPTATSAKLAWNAASDNVTPAAAIVYDIFQASSPKGQNFSTPSFTTPAGATEFIVSNLEAGRSYFFVVRARDTAGNRDQNSRELATNVVDQAPPVFSGVAGLERLSPTSIRATWAAARDDRSAASALVYHVYLATQSGAQNFSSPAKISPPGATSLDLTDLDPTARYFVVVRSRDEAGNQDGNVVEASLLAGQNAAVAPDVLAPTFSGADAVEKRTSGSLTISWRAATDDRSGPDALVYDVYLATRENGQDFSRPSATSEAGATTMTISSGISNDDYYVVVRARDAAGNRDANTRQATTFRTDDERPVFTGVAGAKEIAPSIFEVSWPEAKDNKSGPRDLVYDIFVATRPRGQNFASFPAATSPPGATSHSFRWEGPPAPVFYLVVRARDEAGNRDENTTEIELVSVSYLLDEVDDLTRALFKAYENKNSGAFMDLVAPGFAGIDNSGNALSYSTLGNSLVTDFQLLSSVSLDPVISSIRDGGAGQVVVDVIWSGRFRFASTGLENVVTGKSTRLVWDYSVLPMELIAWEGSSPFGLTSPVSGSTTTTDIATPITLTSVSGNFDFDITSDFTDFAGRRYVFTGDGFKSGALVEWHDGDWNWEVVGQDATHREDASHTVVSGTQLTVDLIQYFLAWCPETELLGGTEAISIYFRVVNPDGQYSNEIQTFGTVSAGPLADHSAFEQSPGFSSAISNVGGTHWFELRAYNIAPPSLGAANIAFFRSDGVTSATEWSNIQVQNVWCDEFSGSGTPVQALSFSADLSDPTGEPSYVIALTDGRPGEEARFTMPVGIPPAPSIWSVMIDGNFGYVYNTPGSKNFLLSGADFNGSNVFVEILENGSPSGAWTIGDPNPVPNSGGTGVSFVATFNDAPLGDVTGRNFEVRVTSLGQSGISSPISVLAVTPYIDNIGGLFIGNGSTPLGDNPPGPTLGIGPPNNNQNKDFSATSWDFLRATGQGFVSDPPGPTPGTILKASFDGANWFPLDGGPSEFIAVGAPTVLSGQIDYDMGSVRFKYEDDGVPNEGQDRRTVWFVPVNPGLPGGVSGPAVAGHFTLVPANNLTLQNLNVTPNPVVIPSSPGWSSNISFELDCWNWAGLHPNIGGMGLTDIWLTDQVNAVLSEGSSDINITTVDIVDMHLNNPFQAPRIRVNMQIWGRSLAGTENWNLRMRNTSGTTASLPFSIRN